MDRTLPSHTTPRTNRPPRRSRAYSALAATLLLAACGALASCGDGDSSGSTTSSITTGAAGSGGTNGGGGTGAAGNTGGTGATAASGGTGATGGTGGMSTASGGSGGMGCAGPETCLDFADEDCDGTECGLWGRLYGDASGPSAFDSAVLPSGEVYFSGNLFSEFGQAWTMQFGGMSYLGKAGLEGFVAKLSPLGDELWIRQIPVRKNSEPYLGGTTSGGVAMLIPFTDVIDLGGGPLLSNPPGLGQAIAVYSADGSLVWAKTIDGGLGITQLATSPAGKVVLAGSFSGDSSYDGQTLTAAPLTGKCLLEVDEQDGSLIWAYAFVSSIQSVIHTLTVDVDDNVLLGGYYSGPFHLGGPSLPQSAPNNYSGFLGTWDGNGNLLSSIEVCHGDCEVRQIVPAANGDLYLSGTFQGASVQIGPKTVNAANGLNHSFATKLTPDFQYPWIHAFISTTARPHLAVDADGNVTFALLFQGDVDLGFDYFDAIGSSDLALGKLTTDGTPLWARHFGAPGAWFNMPTVALGLQPDGGATLTIALAGSVDYGFGPMNTAGDVKNTVLRFAP